MKCDVCLTKIPIGQNVCPNCGFKMKSEHINLYDADSQTHEHIQVNKDYLRNRINTQINDNVKAKINARLNDDIFTKKTRKTYINPKHSTKKDNTKIVASIVKKIVIVTILFTFIVTGFVIIGTTDFIFDDGFSISNIFNDDDTIETASQYKDNLINYLEENGYTDITIDKEENSQNDDSSTRAFCSISTKRNDISYNITTVHQHNQLRSINLTLYGHYDKSVDIKKFNLKESAIEELAQYLEEENIYDILKDSHSLMKEEKKNRYQYSIYDNPNIYMSEEYNSYSNPYYSFYYSIEFENDIDI